MGINFRSNVEEAQKTLSELPGKGHQLFQGDISEKANCQSIVDEFIKNYGQLDVLVNNAGISIFHEIDKVDFDHWTSAWENTFKTNLFAAANMTFCAAQAMMKSGGGRIVNVSSRGSFRGEPTKPAYGASKAALNAMTQSLAKNWPLTTFISELWLQDSRKLKWRQ